MFDIGMIPDTISTISVGFLTPEIIALLAIVVVAALIVGKKVVEIQIALPVVGILLMPIGFTLGIYAPIYVLLMGWSVLIMFTKEGTIEGEYLAET